MSSKIRLTVRVLSGLLALGGIVLVVMGAITWGMTSSELTSQKIDVAGNSYELDGKEVPDDLKANIANGPFDALSQIKLIQLHTGHSIEGMGFPEGTTYTDIPMPDSAELAACKKDPTSSPDCADNLKNDAARSLFDNSNSKQASLYTSVLAFGVSALVVGVGVVLVVVAVIAVLLTLRKKGAAGTPTRSTPEAAAAATS